MFHMIPHILFNNLKYKISSVYILMHYILIFLSYIEYKFYHNLSMPIIPLNNSFQHCNIYLLLLEYYVSNFDILQYCVTKSKCHVL